MNELIKWLKEKINNLENELRMYKTLLELLEPSQQPPGEKVEEVKVGGRSIAKVFIGDRHVRLVFEEPIALPSEIREYLESVREDIRALQARNGTEETVNLVIRERPDDTVMEVRLENLQPIVEILKAKACLKYAAEATYQLKKLKELT